MNNAHTCSNEECCKGENALQQCCGGNCSQEGSVCTRSQECKEGVCSCCHEAGDASSCCKDKPATL